MPKFDVHLYVQVRVKFGEIEAESREEAAAEAVSRYRRYSGCEDLFGITTIARHEGVVAICDCENHTDEEILVDEP